MINITVNGVSYPVPSSAADVNWAADQVAFEQALATIISALAAQPFAETTLTDGSATPGGATANTVRGRNAFGVGEQTITITNSLVTTASQVVVTLEAIDPTLTHIRSVQMSNGLFTIVGNNTATGVTKVSWTVINS